MDFSERTEVGGECAETAQRGARPKSNQLQQSNLFTARKHRRSVTWYKGSSDTLSMFRSCVRRAVSSMSEFPFILPRCDECQTPPEYAGRRPRRGWFRQAPHARGLPEASALPCAFGW